MYAIAYSLQYFYTRHPDALQNRALFADDAAIITTSKLTTLLTKNITRTHRSTNKILHK